MKGKLIRWLARFEPVHKATTRAAREAVYRLRYDAYVGELNRRFDGVDHARRWFTSEEDELPESTIFYTGKLPDITGTMRLRTWAPGRVPAKEAKWYAVDRFSGIERLTTGEIGRLAVRSDARGRLIVPALLCAAYHELVGVKHGDLAFCMGTPGLVRSYRQFGALPYGADLVSTGPGPVQVPLVCVPSDAALHRRLDSFFAPLIKEYFGPGKRAPLDTAPFRHILESGRSTVEHDPGKVWEGVRSAIQGKQAAASVLGASAAVTKKLARSGFLLNLRAGELVIREGVKEFEIYIVLNGDFEVFRDSGRVALVSTGDLIGEIAFFTGSGQRTASVRAVSDGRLLVLRRKFLLELVRSDPDAGYSLLMNMSRTMAERLQKLIQDA